MQVPDLTKPESILTLGVISSPSSPLMSNKLRIVATASRTDICEMSARAYSGSNRIMNPWV